MSTRLERHQREQARKKYLVLGLVIVGVLVFFWTIGVPMFVNLSGKAGAMLGGSSQSADNSGDVEFSDVEITNIPDATNSAELDISGTVSNIDNLTIFLNGSVEKKIDVSKKSDFEARIDGLESGTNEVYASGSRAGSKNVRETQKYTVTYREGKPKLEIESPGDGSSTPRDEISVTGKTESGSGFTVQVNGIPTVRRSDGGFTATVRLKEGDNKITVNVSDDAGNSEEKSITVKYEK